MKITERKSACDKGVITLYRLENASGAWVELSTLGAGVTGVGVPDRDGRIENVALGYANPADYLYDGPCMGKCPGRYANRIARGHLAVGGKEYQLNINNGPNALHGGPEGFQNRIWQSRVLENGVEFSYVSEDGEENYPGRLEVTARYTWSDNNELTLQFTAVTDSETVVNLTNHSYWNLDGADAGSVLNHVMRLAADTWLPTDETQIPLGTPEPVEGTPMYFRDFKAIGRDINAGTEALRIGKGYDHCWMLRDWQPGRMLREAASLHSDVSGRTLHIDTDQPGVQIYTGNWLDGSPLNHSGKSYNDYEGVAIEMQGIPDAPNQSQFPSQTLRPGEKYLRTISFRFTAE